MADRGRDPYQTLGVSPSTSDDELRSAYHRLVQLHHPDHNRGSSESARRFEAVQEAYARIRELRKATPGPKQPPPRGAVDPEVESRMADLEREVREAHRARERARQAAREAAAGTGERPSDERLGYVTTDDSLSKILADARSELAERFSEAREHPVVQRVTELIEDLDELSSGLKRKPPSPSS
jgi:curved DNA-binding protein CbpA